MIPRRFLALFCILGLTAATALSQYYEYDEEEDRPQRKQEVPVAGFWPTQKMMEHIVDRFTEQEMAKALGLDDDQLFQTREAIKENLVPWLNENRGEIMQATNEFMEAWLDKKPPSAEWVADWAQRTLPLLDGLADQVEVIGEEMNTFLTEEQQAVLAGELAGVRVVTGMTAQRLGGWAEGGFEPRTDWHRSREYKQAEEIRTEETHTAVAEAKGDYGAPLAAAGPGAGQPHDQRDSATPRTPRGEAAPVDAWTKYTDDFVRRYNLSEQQQSQAYRCLRKIQTDRDKYLRRNADRFVRAEATLRDSGATRQHPAAQRVLDQRAKTLDNKFTRLKEGLNKLPNRKQRLAAAQNPPAAQAAHAETRAKRESPSSP